MKTISVPISWLAEIDGMSVADAITYLSTLPLDHILISVLEGDTHGCDIRSELHYKRPYTTQELDELAALRKAHKIQSTKDSIQYYEKQRDHWRKYGHHQQADGYEATAARFRKKLEELV